MRNRQELNQADSSLKFPSFDEVREAIFANPYYGERWTENFQFPVYDVTLRSLLAGLLSRGNPFGKASKRTIESQADLRWGPDLRGQRKLLHPNGVCLVGKWKIFDEIESSEHSNYTGLFAPGSTGRVIGRYSTCCRETRRGRMRSIGLVGKVYCDAEQEEQLPPASFVTQQDLGGVRTSCINDVVMQNAPNTTFWRRGGAIPVLLWTGLTFMLTDQEITHRQLYQIGELTKPVEIPTSVPTFMRLIVSPDQARNQDQVDFRNEVLWHIYHDDSETRQIKFEIQVSNDGWTLGPSFLQRRLISNWQTIGSLVFDAAVASYNGDFVIHFHHPKWRNKRTN